jgi:hypothetical protein
MTQELKERSQDIKVKDKAPKGAYILFIDIYNDFIFLNCKQSSGETIQYETASSASGLKSSIRCARATRRFVPEYNQC